MSIPIIGPVVAPVIGFAPPITALPDTVPFTARSGATFAEEFYLFRNHFDNVVIPQINDNKDELVEKWNAAANAFSEAINQGLVDFADDFNTKIGEVNSVASTLEEKTIELTNYVNTKIDEVIGSSIEVTDPVVAGMFQDKDSETRAKTDSLYPLLDPRGVGTLTENNLSVQTGAPVALARFADLATNGNWRDALYAAVVEANRLAAFGRIRPVYAEQGVYEIPTPIDFGGLSVVLEGPGVYKYGSNGFGTITQPWDEGFDGIHDYMRVLISAGGLSNVDTFTKESIFRPSNPQSIVGAKNGSLFFLDSDDKYTGKFVSGEWSTPRYTFKAGYFPVSGIGLNVGMIAGNGGIPVDSIITGSISGATARVRGNRRILGETSLNVSLFLTDVTDAATGQPSTFVNGDIIRVNGQDRGVMLSNPYLIASHTMIDPHSTGAKLHKRVGPDVVVDIRDVTFDVLTNSDSPIPSAQRKPCLSINGVNAPLIENAKWLDGYTRAIQLAGTFRGRVIHAEVNKLSNDANTDYQGYGYFVEVTGSTEFTDISINGQDVRHPVTTNCTARETRHTADIYRAGVPKWTKIHNGTFSGTVSAAMDEHGGAYRTWWHNLRVVGVSGGRDTATGGMGAQIRGAGSMVTDCVIENVTHGIVARPNSFLYEWDVQTIIARNHVENATAHAYEFGGVNPVDSTRRNSILSIDNSYRMNGETLAVGGNKQTPVIIHSGDVTIVGGIHQRFNDTPIVVSVDAGPNKIGNIAILRQVFDYTETTYTGAPVKFYGTPAGYAIIDDLTAFSATVGGSGGPSGWVHISGVSGVVKTRIGRLSAPMRTNNVPLYITSGGSTTDNYEYVAIRQSGNMLYGTKGGTPIPSIPANSSVDIEIDVMNATASDVVAGHSFSLSYPATVLVKQTRVIAATAVDQPGKAIITLYNASSSASAATANGTFNVVVLKRGGVV